jgi:phosphonate degradation associated HDIG domain protein
MKSPATAATMADTIADLFRRKGGSLYGGESVTQLEHALQAAQLAEQTGATPASIVAALLHDVGHLLHDLPDDAPDDGIDDVHERLGDHWLRKAFEPAVCDPVRLHVAAKRYLCTVDSEYQASLSPASLQSLHLQGGPFNRQEAREFEAEPYFKESVELRRWDDLAKEPGLETPSLAHFLTYLSACMRQADPVQIA